MKQRKIFKCEYCGKIFIYEGAHIKHIVECNKKPKNI